MKRKLSPKLTQAKVDKVWSPLIKDKWHNRCAICGSQQHLQSHHIMGKKSRVLRYSIDNGICLCFNHHMGFQGVHSSDASVALATIRLIQEKLGPDRWEQLLALKQDKRKLSLAEALEMLTA